MLKTKKCMFNIYMYKEYHTKRTFHDMKNIIIYDRLQHLLR